VLIQRLQFVARFETFDKFCHSLMKYPAILAVFNVNANTNLTDSNSFLSLVGNTALLTMVSYLQQEQINCIYKAIFKKEGGKKDVTAAEIKRWIKDENDTPKALPSSRPSNSTTSDAELRALIASLEAKIAVVQTKCYDQGTVVTYRLVNF